MTARTRYDFVDVLRGTAIAMMFIYHFSFDLNMFGFVDIDFYNDPVWLHFRTLIVSTFVAVVGISLYLAHRHQIRWMAYARRIVILILSAALVSVTTYIMFAERWVFFGILHFIALGSVVGIAFVRFYWLNLALGTALILFGNLYAHTFFNQPQWQWIGLMTHKPLTEDYVPVLPWLGVILLGIFFGKLIYQGQYIPLLLKWQGRSRLAAVLRFGGRHSLIIYLLHQPIFIGLLYGVDTVLT